MEFQRARNEEQKTIRVNQIVDAALELYQSMPYDEITLTAITSRLDFTRANLYKYFSTKEEIFLVIIDRDLQAWVEDVCEELASHGIVSIQEFSGIWASKLYRHKRLVELFAILNTVIERNVSVEALTVFKKSMFQSVSKVNAAMVRAVPGLTTDLSYLFFNFQMHYAMGLYPATAPNPIQEEAVRRSGIPYETEEFVPAFSKFLTIVLQGLIMRNPNS